MVCAMFVVFQKEPGRISTGTSHNSADIVSCALELPHGTVPSMPSNSRDVGVPSGMALTGDRAWRGSTVVVLWVLLVAGVALVATLRCSPISDLDRQQLTGAAVSSATPQERTQAAQSVDVHFGCQLPASMPATVAPLLSVKGAPHGWWVSTVVTILILGTLAGSTRGPTSQRRTCFLRGGRARLHYFCVMRS